jgi:hypothetical protein
LRMRKRHCHQIFVSFGIEFGAKGREFSNRHVRPFIDDILRAIGATAAENSGKSHFEIKLVGLKRRERILYLLFSCFAIHSLRHWSRKRRTQQGRAVARKALKITSKIRGWA